MKVLIVHNRYRSDSPSGENMVVDLEAQLLEQFGCQVARLEAFSDTIQRRSVFRRAKLPGEVMWSNAGYGAVKRAAARYRPDVIHFHNVFPLLSYAAVWAARDSQARVV